MAGTTLAQGAVKSAVSGGWVTLRSGDVPHDWNDHWRACRRTDARVEQ